MDGSQTGAFGWKELNQAISALRDDFAKVPAPARDLRDFATSSVLAAKAGSAVALAMVDSHTLGEPTRWVLTPPPFAALDIVARRAEFDLRHQAWRASVVDAPRGEASIVGALVLEPSQEGTLAQLLFFNNVGSLPMCVHGTIGVLRSMAAYCALPPGHYEFETPAGRVAARHDGQKEAAQRLGAELDPQGEYDVVVECAGNSAALAQAARLCKPGATILLLATYWGGVELPGFDVSLKALKIFASSMYDRQGLVLDVEVAAQLMARRPELADVFITHRLPLEAAAEAFDIAADRAAGAIKVVLEP